MFNSNMAVLSNDQIRQIAPSAFAEQPHHSRSERYAFIPTSRVIDAMRDNGFLPVRAMQSRTRVADKIGYTKHMITFRRARDVAVRALGDTSAEIVLVNSHGGESAYNLMGGLFRLACLNGMVVKMADVEALKVPHSGNVVDRVIEGSFRVIDTSTRALDVAQQWAGITLSHSEQHAFGEAAARLRWDEAHRVNAGMVTRVRRDEDSGADLWRTFNRAQETLIRGGIRVETRNPETYRLRRGTARPVNSIDGNVGLNQALWTLATEMAKIKGGESIAA